MQIRVVSLNLNRQGKRRAAALNRWLGEVEPDLIAAQEDGLPIPGFHLLSGGGYAAIHVRDDRLHEITRLATFEDRWCAVEVGGTWIHCVYLDHSSAKARRELLERLREGIGASAVVLGDFNLAPLPDDGLFGQDPSAFTTAAERRAFQALLRDRGLVDAWASGPRPENRFTFEQVTRGLPVRFRCDLALVGEGVGLRQIRHEHRTRLGEGAFTDHSAIVLDLALTEAAALALPLAAEPPPTPLRVEGNIRPERSAIRRNGPSAPLRDALGAGRLVRGTRVLDWGCGRGDDLEALRGAGFDAAGYDPHPGFGSDTTPVGSFDVVLLTFVLNVLPPRERIAALRDAWNRVGPGGALLVTTRSARAVDREARAGGWPAFYDGFCSQPGVLQRGFTSTELAALARDNLDGIAQLELRDPTDRAEIWVRRELGGLTRQRG